MLFIGRKRAFNNGAEQVSRMNDIMRAQIWSISCALEKDSIKRLRQMNSTNRFRIIFRFHAPLKIRGTCVIERDMFNQDFGAGK
jgi:hypothetical protein